MLEPHFEHLAIRFRPGLEAAARRAVYRRCGLEPYRPHHELPDEPFALGRVAGRSASLARCARAMTMLRDHPDVTRVAPVFRRGSTLIMATERIWIGFRHAGRAAAVLGRLRRSGARVIETRDGDSLVRLGPGHDPLHVCRSLARLASVAYVEPDHVLVGRRMKSSAGKARPVQAALREVGAVEAWKIQPIDSTIRVAVLDCGVLARHPDLRGAVVASFDATGKENAVRPSPWDSHGTECAGLIGATGRGKTGIRGVASGCGLVSVRIGRTPTRLADYVSKVSWLVAGIDWAWKHGAAVLSMSFGGGPRAIPVEKALSRARSQGRSGKGCVLVAAVGNDGTAAVEFPASDAGVIGVASVTRQGKAASFSNHGPAVTLAAPGVNVTTTTIPDPAEGEPSLYLTDSGTSLSTPIVAGAGALVVAANPQLTERAVRRILTGTALGRHSLRTGAGRLDIPKAIRAARRTP